jgi:hypothetical protein
MNTMRLLLALAMLCAAAAADAGERLLLAGGEYADAAYYTYTGLVVQGARDSQCRGFSQRYWLDRYGYEYEGAPGLVQADVWGAEAALGYGGGSADGWWNVSLGARYTDTDLDPDDPSANARGSQIGAKVQVEFEHSVAAQWRVAAIASYTSQQNGYWGRARAMRSFGPTYAAGAEFVATGNDEADATAAGLVLAVKPADSRWSVNLRAGYRFQDVGDGAYGGLELGYAF